MIDALKESLHANNSLITPVYSYYDIGDAYSFNKLDNIIRKPKETWMKQSFFSRPEPNVDKIIKLGTQIQADVVLLYYLRVGGSTDLINSYLIDIKSRKVILAEETTEEFTAGEGAAKVIKTTNEVFQRLKKSGQ